MSEPSSAVPAEALEPNLEQARGAALTAHEVVIKFRELGLPESFDDDLAALCTDLGDLWAAHSEISDRIDLLLKASGGWADVGDRLVDLRSSIDHIGWHVKSVRQPINRITRFALGQARESEPGSSR